MTVLHILDERYDSGITHYGLALARGLAARGTRVAVMARAGLPAAREASASELAVWPVGGRGDLAGARRRARRERIDLINAHTGSGFVWGVWVSGGRIPVVRTRGDARPVRCGPINRLAYRRAARVIACAEFIRRDLVERLRLPGDTVTTVYQGVDVVGRSKGRGRVGAASWPPVGAVAGVLGRLDPVKGHRVFLEAAARVKARVPASSFAVAGRDEHETAEGLRRVAGSLGLRGEDVRFLGHVRDAAEFIRGCAIGVVSSVGSEAVSRAALEWMAEGRPLVATRVGILPEMVEDGVTGYLVPPRDPVRMADRISQLLLDPALAASMGRAAAERVKERFSLDRFVGGTLEVYQEALA